MVSDLRLSPNKTRNLDRPFSFESSTPLISNREHADLDDIPEHNNNFNKMKSFNLISDKDLKDASYEDENSQKSKSSKANKSNVKLNVSSCIMSLLYG